MQLAQKRILPLIRERIVLVAPMAIEEEPASGCVFIGGRGLQFIVCNAVGIPAQILEWIPHRSPVRAIVQQSEGQDVRLQARCGVHGVRSRRTIEDWSLPNFLDSAVGVRGPEIVLGGENGFGHAVLEADHGVLPVADVVAESEAQDFVAVVVAVEEKEEGVEDVVGFGDGDEEGGGGGAPAVCESFEEGGWFVGWRD